MLMQNLAWEGPLPVQEVVKRLKVTLFGAMAQKAEPEAIQAEIIRVALWEQCVLRQPGTFSDASTLTQQLLRRARELWSPFHDAALQGGMQGEEALTRQTLAMLAEQGDLLALPHGHWLPAPLRLVPVPARSERYLLVGGMPGSLLPKPLFNALRLHGSFRQVKATVIQANPSFSAKDSHWQFQTLEDWLGTPPPAFQELLNSFRNIKMESVSYQNSGQSSEAYNALVNKPQLCRWQPLEHISANGRYLLREKTHWGKVSYSVGKIDNQEIKEQSHLLDSLGIRRLCYALDADAGVPTKATWTQKGEQGILSLSTELPAWERKQLATLGRLQQQGQKYYPRVWRIALQHESTIKELLTQLGVTLVSKKDTI